MKNKDEQQAQIGVELKNLNATWNCGADLGTEKGQKWLKKMGPQ